MCAYLMKGDNDGSLSWRFTGTVTIELLNQLEDKNHHKETSYNIIGVRTAFISYADLDYNADENTQYLEDDTLVFRVSVQVPEYKPRLEPTI